MLVSGTTSATLSTRSDFLTTGQMAELLDALKSFGGPLESRSSKGGGSSRGGGGLGRGGRR